MSCNVQWPYIHLVRHPETDWNSEKRYQSHSERPYTAIGIQQSDELVSKLCSLAPSHIYTSPTLRCAQIAERVAQNLNRPVTQALNLAEVDHGNWEGLTYQEVKTQYAETYRERFSDILHSTTHEGENLSQVHSRVREFFNTLRETKDIVRAIVITHSTPIQLMLCQALGAPPTDYWKFPNRSC